MESVKCPTEIGSVQKKATGLRSESDALDNSSPDQKLSEEEELTSSTLLIMDEINGKEKNLSIKGKEKNLSSDAEATKNISLASTDEKDDLSGTLHSSPIRSFVGRSRRKLLILDLNGLLADIVSPPPKDYKADIYIARRAIFKRPFCHDFLRFCFERFQVGVWSSRTRKNVEKVTDFLMGDMKHKMLFFWDQSHCTATKFKTPENQHKTLVFKELRRIWEKEDPNLPWVKGDYNESNTLLLDDSPYKALLNPPNTAIFPYSYKFQDRCDNSLGEEGDIRIYLEELAEAENVQEFVEKHPFGQAAITEASEYWGFYLQVNNSLNSFPTMS